MQIKNNSTIRKLNDKLEAMTDEKLYEVFQLYCIINSEGVGVTSEEKFNVFLETFEKNPFRRNFDLAHRKQLIGNLITYTDDALGLIRGIEYIQNGLTLEETIENLYASMGFCEDYPFV